MCRYVFATPPEKLRFRDDEDRGALLGASHGAIPTRRKRPGVAAAAYSLALNVTGDAQEAASIATIALRKGAGSRTAVLAHARHESVLRPASHEVGQQVVSPTDLRALAGQLAQTRPPLERAIVDLELRCALDTGSLARVLGLTTARSVKYSKDIAESWAVELDPAMMAWLGPGSCDDMARVLTTGHVWPRGANNPVVSSIDSTGPVPVLRTGTDGVVIEPLASPTPQTQPIAIGQLTAVAPAVQAHARDCEVCAERLRLLTPVRALFGQMPLAEVPQTVAFAARTARRRLPAPLPPSVEPRWLDYLMRLRVPALGVVAAMVVLAAGILIFNNEQDNGGPSQNERVQALLDQKPSTLLGTPTIVTRGVTTALVANTGSAPVQWSATSDSPWLKLQPSSGTLSPSQSISIALTASPPPGVTDATITIKGNDGSVQTLQYDGS